MVTWISPIKLAKQSIPAAVVFLLAFVAFSLNVAIVGLQSYRYFRLSFGSLVSVVWYLTMTALLCDLMSTLLIPSRSLQGGTVIAFGIVTIMQCPLVALFIRYELSTTNKLALVAACVEHDHASDCSAWLTSFEHAQAVPAALACGAHVVVLACAAWYVRRRAPTTAAILPDYELEHLKKKKDKREKNKNASHARKTQTGPPPSRGDDDSGSDDVDDGWKRSNASAVHTDSDDDEDRDGLIGRARLDQQTLSEKSLGRRGREGRE
ncbi:hypothetical protein JCM11491_001722 [Sporobolomyces phaffii]